MKSCNPLQYFIIVIEDTTVGKIVAAGSLILEFKFIHENGLVGHIEDIVVESQQRGNQLGRRIIEQLKSIGISLQCYKIILDCAEKNVGFYEKTGFAVKGKSAKNDKLRFHLFINEICRGSNGLLQRRQ
jgi:glucosamine-phosphate N-acetyltransferase